MPSGMHILLRNTTIVDPGGPLDGQRKNILISEGMVREISDLQAPSNAEVWEAEGLHVSPGWVDIGAHTMDPGFEHREDMASFREAAAAGGYTAVAAFPNTDPFIHAKAEVLYLQQANGTHPVRVLPVGAVSRNGAGEDLAEIYDMHMSGAVAFSDGSNPIQRSGLLLRALQYVKAIDGLVIDQPLDLSLASRGQVHEGPVSTALGMRGIPSLAESSMVYRNIQLLQYADSRLLLHGISSADSLGMIRSARASGLRLMASVTAWNLAFTDAELSDFNTLFKLMPPLRGESDREALREALIDGTIDAIVSGHLPLEDDQKDVEFPYAGFGASGLETAFALCNTSLRSAGIGLDVIVSKLSLGPRRLLGLPEGHLEPGVPADFTLFQPDLEWDFRLAAQRSKGRNTPLDGHRLTGRPYGVIRDDFALRFPVPGN